MEIWVWFAWRFLFSIRYSRNIFIKKHKTLSNNPSIHIYINRINIRLVPKIKNEYKLKLQASETIKLFGSTKSQ